VNLPGDGMLRRPGRGIGRQVLVRSNDVGHGGRRLIWRIVRPGIGL